MSLLLKSPFAVKFTGNDLRLLHRRIYHPQLGCFGEGYILWSDASFRELLRFIILDDGRRIDYPSFLSYCAPRKR
jgi:hypothetical protein